MDPRAFPGGSRRETFGHGVVICSRVTSEGTRPLSVRESGKAERRRRLKAAALAVFAEKGYDAATTREIAERAGLGPATLFRYAQAKHDLLLMIVNDELNEINARAFAALDPNASLIDALITLLAPRYRYWAAAPDLAREAIHITVIARANDDTTETQRYRDRRAALGSVVADLIRREQSMGRLRADEDAEFLADFLLDVYLAHRRRWLSEAHPTAEAGIRGVRRMLQLALEGVGTR